MKEFFLGLPVSVNQAYKYWRNRVVLTKKGKAYKTDVYLRLNKSDFKDIYHAERLCFLFEFYRPDKRKRDVQNLTKILFDAMQGIVMKDDCQVHWVSYGWSDEIKKGGGVLVRVWKHKSNSNKE